MPNRQIDRLKDIIRAQDPDLVLAVETDEWWCGHLDGALPHHPFRIAHPLPNTYGMMLLSRLELVDPEVRFLLKPDIPSIRTGVRLRSGDVIMLYGLHPEPPSPTEAATSLPRDAELVMAGREIAQSDRPTLVAGDLNDVAWSHTSRLFRRIARMLDPRAGRGVYNTFHARYWFLRWPLDHVFVSNTFLLRHLQRLPAFGSDHFPIFIAVDHAPAASAVQEAPAPDAEDRAEARDKLQRAAATEAGRPAQPSGDRAYGSARSRPDVTTCCNSSSSTKAPGSASGKSSAISPVPTRKPARACSQTAAAAASRAGMPWTKRPSTMPASTSPEPAVASAGGASG